MEGASEAVLARRHLGGLSSHGHAAHAPDGGPAKRSATFLPAQLAFEAMQRYWQVRPPSVRPSHAMRGHTGFIITGPPPLAASPPRIGTRTRQLCYRDTKEACNDRLSTSNATRVTPLKVGSKTSRISSGK